MSDNICENLAPNFSFSKRDTYLRTLQQKSSLVPTDYRYNIVSYTPPRVQDVPCYNKLFLKRVLNKEIENATEQQARDEHDSLLMRNLRRISEQAGSASTIATTD